MGQMYATCGHEISLEWMMGGQADVTTKYIERDGSRSTSYRVVCPECLVWYEKEHLILKDQSAKMRWLRRGRNVEKRKKQKRVLAT